MIEYKLKHIGINCENDQEAGLLLQQLCATFNLSKGNENDSHVFAGNLFEVMKNAERGKHGHIAVQTNDVEGAMQELAAKGFTFKEETVRKNADGKIIFVYLEQELGGFAFHLTV